MASFTAKDVQALRQSTGAGMMDAKKALTEADGDAEAAAQILREKGLAKAATRTDRDNTEGMIAIARDGNTAAMVHLRAETDFSAKSPDFVQLVQELAELVLKKGADAVAERADDIDQLKLSKKENIELGLVERFEAAEGNSLDCYLHAGGTVGVLVEGKGLDEEALHEVALHAAFAKPTFLSRDEVPSEAAAKERAALLEITKAEGKPEQAWDKIVEGRLTAWYKESVLLEQGIFGEKETVKSRLGDAEIVRFALAAIGS